MSLNLKESFLKEEQNNYNLCGYAYMGLPSVINLQEEWTIAGKRHIHCEPIANARDSLLKLYELDSLNAEIIVRGISVYEKTNPVHRLRSQRIVQVDSVSSNLHSFKKAINEAKYMLDFEDGWDDGEAKAISSVLFETSCKIVSDYLERLYLSGSPKSNPAINPVTDGSIDFEWGSEKSRLLINFKIKPSGEIEGSYYGDLWNNKLPTKGSVPADKVYTHLLDWMKYL